MMSNDDEIYFKMFSANERLLEPRVQLTSISISYFSEVHKIIAMHRK